MKRSSILLALAALGFSARQADAQQTYYQACLAVCDAALPGGSIPETSARGWCYIMRCGLP
jgi:hypothetical protein